MNNAGLTPTAPVAARLNRTAPVRDSDREARAYNGLIGSLLRRSAARRRALSTTNDGRPRPQTAPTSPYTR